LILEDLAPNTIDNTIQLTSQELCGQSTGWKVCDDEFRRFPDGQAAFKASTVTKSLDPKQESRQRGQPFRPAQHKEAVVSTSQPLHERDSTNGSHGTLSRSDQDSIRQHNMLVGSPSIHKTPISTGTEQSRTAFGQQGFPGDVTNKIVEGPGGSRAEQLQRSASASMGDDDSSPDCCDMTLPDQLQHLSLLVKSLREQNARLTGRLDHGNDSGTEWPTLYRVCCMTPGNYATYVDSPVWLQNDESGHTHMDGRRRIPSEQDWEEQQDDAPFIVYLTYYCADHPKNARTRPAKMPSDKTESEDEDTKRFIGGVAPRSEEVFIRSYELRQSLHDCISLSEQLGAYFQTDLMTKGRVYAPYLMYYHFKDILRNASETLEGLEFSDYNKLMDYFEFYMAKKTSKANAMFLAGRVAMEFIPYLFTPGQLLLKQDKHGFHAIKQNSVLSALSSKDASLPKKWRFNADSIQFDGTFHKKVEIEDLAFPSSEDLVNITDLDIFPLQYAGPYEEQNLLERGKRFWACRVAKYLAGPADSDRTNQDVRYMVDAKTYNLLHNNSTERQLKALFRKEIGTTVISGGEDDKEFLLCLPATIEAFNMQEKKWLKVPIDLLKDVSWNTDAFEFLAVDKKTKVLLKALVTNKIEADQSTDVVAGKGAGLIVLLHGGPGTGKTLTAESVAEFAKKPLYRITCGDIGTKPKEVEEYLEAAFQLGRTWDCVVLLDEADVFLEQRTSNNLERNALVSVFLRVLEYYDGILLLTSNRVGTFDEAFKSRIQLALHYDNLDKGQRHQIWANFLNRLENLNVDMDFAEIRGKIGILAGRDMNGRQIRNVITTARQLAKHEKTQVKYDHLVHVMDVSRKFDDYLLEVNDHVTDAERQRDDGVR
jgi:hypothetical protein